MKLLIPILIIITNLTSFANSISIKDTNAVKGQVISIPVYADITENFIYLDTLNTFKIDFEYNALMLDVKEIVTDGTTLISSNNLKMTNTLNNVDYKKSNLSIEFDDELSVGSGILFYIKLEVLAGPDLTTTITPMDFKLRGNEINADYLPGNITIPQPVSEVDKSYLSNFYPNPFHRYSRAELKITKPTRIKVSTYNIAGANVLSGFCYADCLEKHFELTGSDGKKYNGDEQLFEGDYLLEIKNDFSTLAAGAYLLVIETDYKVLTQRFVVIK